MKTSQFQSLLNRLNKRTEHKDIFLSPLSKTVDYGKYWDELPTPKMSISSGDGPYSFYFIKNEHGVYVAVVLDMCTDLHWYVGPKHRKKGILTNAMAQVILPDLSTGRETQQISIDPQQLSEEEVEASQAVALNLGFVFRDSGDRGFVYELDLAKLKKRKPSMASKGMSEERLKELKRKLNYHSRSLWVIESEVAAAFGNVRYSTQLMELVDGIRKHTWKLEDVYYDFKKANGEQS
ncbi:hypothetical protein GM921_09525 [Pedobacter sp. LMG 31464]|uniref:Uncharacterized protein n=1 Tax=Pedobacter planticolens TaxID=2679964 RepID=A0A923IUB2_9SPHI|nr:hypothetical protein [Pedobacter planticolens]MBB2145725.1 hypothetical protein [Pedobacter planticolens]